jgi:thiamine-phosphate pyrophosphorylase
MSNNIKPSQLQLYAITDRHWLKGRELSQAVEEALQNGATTLQLREKNLSHCELLEEAQKVQAVAAKYSVPFIINDNIDIAREIDADGVHIGQTDMALSKAREILGLDKIIGVTAPTVELALEAEKNGADYIGAGAIFPTGTKKDTKPLTLENLLRITQAVSIPVVAIGGINADNLIKLQGTGISGVAVVSAIFGQEDIPHATKALAQLTTQICARK